MLYQVLAAVVFYGHAAVVDFFVDFSNEFIVHYVVVIVIKAGIVHGVYVGFKAYRKHKKGAKDVVSKAKDSSPNGEV
jgi:hypothetical protein